MSVFKRLCNASGYALIMSQQEKRKVARLPNHMSCKTDYMMVNWPIDAIFLVHWNKYKSAVLIGPSLMCSALQPASVI